LNHHSPYRLREAVEAISPDIKARADVGPRDHEERSLWWELSCCLLSSQVPFDLAVAAADRIDTEGLLWTQTGCAASFANDIEALLRYPFEVDGRMRHYRFPTSRGRQLAETHSRVTSCFGSLGGLLSRYADANDARQWLVAHSPGIGPKQASMFLRNIGHSYDLAVLDRHVATYMSALGIEMPGRIASGLTGYMRREQALRSHAKDLGLSVGLMDWAIWIVMRVAKNTIAEPSRA